MRRNTETDLDLHGKKHHEIEVLIQEHYYKTETPFVIITGNSKTMREITKKTLEWLEVKWMEDLPNIGCFLVHG